MRAADTARLAAHVAQHRAAVALQCVAAAFTVAGAYWYGLPGLIAGALAIWFFGMAKPGADSDLDKLTGRGRDE